MFAKMLKTFILMIAALILTNAILCFIPSSLQTLKELNCTTYGRYDNYTFCYLNQYDPGQDYPTKSYRVYGGETKIASDRFARVDSIETILRTEMNDWYTWIQRDSIKEENITRFKAVSRSYIDILVCAVSYLIMGHLLFGNRFKTGDTTGGVPVASDAGTADAQLPEHLYNATTTAMHEVLQHNHDEALDDSDGSEYLCDDDDQLADSDSNLDDSDPSSYYTDSDMYSSDEDDGEDDPDALCRSPLSQLRRRFLVVDLVREELGMLYDEL